MAYQHPFPVSDGGQVETLVPVHQFPVTGLEGGQVVVGERDTQFSGACNQWFHTSLISPS